MHIIKDNEIPYQPMQLNLVKDIFPISDSSILDNTKENNGPIISPINSEIMNFLETEESTNLGRYKVIYFLLIILLFPSPNKNLEITIKIILMFLFPSEFFKKHNIREEKNINK
jgi:hypothetical protein